MRRRVGAEEAKVVIQRIPNKAKKKKFSRCSFRFPFTRRLDDDRLSPLKFCLLKKKILSLSLSVVLSSSSSLCFKGEQQHKEMRREEEMTFSAKL
jgi:hypothetical protein